MKKIVGATFAFVVWLLFRGRPEPLEITANLGDGQRTTVTDGRIFSRAVGDGPDLLLLPGFVGNSQTWEFITPDLAANHRVHLVGQRVSLSNRLGKRRSDHRPIPGFNCT